MSLALLQGQAREDSKLLDPEEQGTTTLRNVGNHSPNEKVSHPTRLVSTFFYLLSSATLL
jgi:hypothetical protein